MTWKVSQCEYSAAMQGYFIVLRDENNTPLAGYHRKELKIGEVFDGRYGRLEGADFGGNPDDFDSVRYRDGNKAEVMNGNPVPAVHQLQHLARRSGGGDR